MPDQNSVERRTRSQITLPDSVVHLNRSPLKEARTTHRNLVEKPGGDGEDESEEDELLLSPKKSTKRTLSPPGVPYTLITDSQGDRPRYKRFKSEFDAKFEEVENGRLGLQQSNYRPSHSRHVSDPNVPVGKKSRKRSATPSDSKKPNSSSSSLLQHAFPKPRARSVPLFPGPTIDLRNPPASPTRARSRSPSKSEPKLAITPGPFKRMADLESIPDEREPAMDVDGTPTKNPSMPFSATITEATIPRPTIPTPTSLETPRTSSTLPGPSMDIPATPAHNNLYSIPMSPLTPLPETPYPQRVNYQAREEDRCNLTQGWGNKLQSVLEEAQPTPKQTERDLPLGLDDAHPTPKQSDSVLTTEATAVVNGQQKTMASRVPLSRNTRASGSGDAGLRTSTLGPPPTAASTSKSAATDCQETDAKRNAFEVLMARKPDTKEKGKITGKKTVIPVTGKGKGKGKQPTTANAKQAESQPLTLKEGKMKPKESATSNPKLFGAPGLKDRMKRRQKPKHTDITVPMRFDDSEDEAPDKDDEFAVARPSSPHPLHLKQDDEKRVSLEPDVEKVPSSPLTSILDEGELSESPEQLQATAEDRGGEHDGDAHPIISPVTETPHRASLLSQIEHADTLRPLTSVTPDAAPRQSSGLEAPQESSKPEEMTADNPQSMAVDEVVQSPAEHTTSAQGPVVDGKGKGKRGSRKKAVVPIAPVRRSARGASSKHNEPGSPSTSTPLTISGRGRGKASGSRSNQSTPSKPKQSELEVFETASPSIIGKGKAPETSDPDPIPDPFDGTLSELSSAPATDTEPEPDEPEKPVKTTVSTASAKSGIPVAKRLKPSASVARDTISSLSKALPKTPTKSGSRSSSPSKLPRPSSLFARANGGESSRPTLAVEGSSYATLESALQKLKEPPPARPSTSMGFNRDLSEDEDVEMRSKDDSSRSALGIGRPSSSASGSSSQSTLPFFKAPAPVQKPRIFVPAGTGPGLKKPGAVMRGGRGTTIPFGMARGQKASQKTTLDTVIGSPVKGGTSVTEKDSDVEMGEPAAESNVPGNLTMADLTMALHVPNGEVDIGNGSLEGLTSEKGKKEKLRRPSMTAIAFQALSQSLNDISALNTSEPTLPPSPPRRAGLRSSSSTYPSSSSAGKKLEGGKNDTTPPKLSILSDCKVFVDYRSDDPLAAETWTQMLKDLGARIMTRLGPTCTHILWKNGLPSTINRYRTLNDPKPHVIGNSWIVTCAQESRHVDETEYLINLEEFKFAAEAAAGHKRRKSMIPKLLTGLGDDADTEDWGTPDDDISMDSNTSISSDLTPLERARLRLSTRT
ncbi:signal transducer [Moniliophthora roreri MCA 2997]|uniref:Signal transducer n=2 Tax=Moniliophthora roreri TaxID=221103 RepID=V2XIU4_MONRO|nr:signal transducer [Moniliophthora roreri MCA 2997]KAI3609599.1 signal transducer [Moniliophthora roreri]